jgi:hypothetical protein
MNKKPIFLVVMFLLGTVATLAQDKEKRGGHKLGGIRAGWHYASLVKDGSQLDTADNLSSYYVGFFRDMKIIPMLHFGSGLEYFQNGTNYIGNSSRILHTISIPLDLKVKLGPVFVLGGTAANFKVSEKLRVSDEDITPVSSDKTAWFDIPVFVGAGLKIMFFTLEARYHRGLIEARDGLHNHYFQLGGAVSF